MDLARRTCVAGLAAVLMLALHGPLQAQDEAPAKKPAKKAASGAKAPAAAAPKAARSPAASDAAVPAPEAPNPAVEAILANDPRTPEELTRSAKILADLGRPDLAKGFIRRVLAAQPGKAQLAAMVEQYGSAMFTAMAGRDDLNPEGKQLAALALDAADRESRDPKKLETLIHQLQDPLPDARYAAAESLAQARGTAVGPLLAVLADPARAAEHVNAKAVLLRLGDDAIRPLVGALECRNPRIVARAAELLGALKAAAARDFLLAPYASSQSDAEVRKAAGEALQSLLGQTPSRIEAAQRLAERAGEYFNHRYPLHEDVNGQLEIWTWDEAAGGPVAHRVPVNEARRMLAARYARDAYAVRPEEESVRLVYLATMLEEASFAAGLGIPLSSQPGSPAAVAAAFGPRMLESVLALAVKERTSGRSHRRSPASGPGGLGGRSVVQQGPCWSTGRGHAKSRSPTAPGRRRSDPAAETDPTFRRLKPGYRGPGLSDQYHRPAPGHCGRSIERGGPARRRLPLGVRLPGRYDHAGPRGGPHGDRPSRLRVGPGGCLAPAAERRYPAPTTPARLPQALVPVGVLARDGQIERARVLIGEDPLGVALIRPHRQQDAKEEVEQVLALAGPSAVGAKEREQQAASAMTMLQNLAAAPATIFDVRRYEPAILAAQAVPGLATRSAVALGDLGSVRSQKALVNQASQTTLPLPVRQAALAAFRYSAEKYGILLTPEAVRLQYDRYNQSARMDAATQQIFGQILDALEAPAQRLKAAARPETAGRQGLGGRGQDAAVRRADRAHCAAACGGSSQTCRRLDYPLAKESDIRIGVAANPFCGGHEFPGVVSSAVPLLTN